MKGFSDPASYTTLHKSMLETIRTAGGIHAKGLHKLEEALFIYEGEGHAFLNDGPGSEEKRKMMGFAGGKNKESRNKAWERVFGFFGKHLKEIE